MDQSQNQTLDQAVALVKHLANVSDDVAINSIMSIFRALKKEKDDMGAILQNYILNFLYLSNPEMIEKLRRQPDSILHRQQ